MEDEDNVDPLGWLQQSDGLFQEQDITIRSKGVSSSIPFRSAERPCRCPRRDWGIPTFQDQMDRNISTYSFVAPTTTGDDDDEREKIDSLTVHLEHRANSTGSDLWDAALVLCHSINRPGVLFDEKPPPSPNCCNDSASSAKVEWSKSSFLELGSGTGAVGMYVCKFLKAQQVILTDLSENLPLIQRNIQENNLQDHTEVAALDWTQWDNLPDAVISTTTKIDFIMGSDLFLPYATFLLEPLARVLSKLLQIHKGSIAVICYEERFDPTAFFVESEKLDLSVSRVADDYLHPFYQDPGRIHMLRITHAQHHHMTPS